MPARRFTVLLAVALALAPSLGGPLRAQEKGKADGGPNAKAPEGFLGGVAKEIRRSWSKDAKAPATGSPIAESDTTMAYAAAVVGFMLVFALAWAFVRVLAFLTVVGSFLGGIGLVCMAVQNKTVTTWEQLTVLVLYVGACAGVSAITANLFLITQGKKEVVRETVTVQPPAGAAGGSA